MKGIEGSAWFCLLTIRYRVFPIASKHNGRHDDGRYAKYKKMYTEKIEVVTGISPCLRPQLAQALGRHISVVGTPVTHTECYLSSTADAFNFKDGGKKCYNKT